MSADIKIFARKLDKGLTTGSLVERLSNLSSEDKLRIKQYKHLDDQQRCLLGIELIHFVINTYVTRGKDFTILRNDLGRPYLLSEVCWDGDFNISHSGDWVVLALTNKGKIGVDIEEIKDIDLSLFSDLFPECSNLNQFYEAWTRRESVLKSCLTCDLYLDSKEITILESYSTRSYYLDESHSMSVCSSNSYFPDEIIII
jgi:4'-phosphopantetheinyl transferase